MSRAGVSLAALTVLLLLAFPSTSLADHCSGIATVEPSSAPAGTTFVFRTNQGAATKVYVYHDGELVRTDTLAGDGWVTYRIRTAAGDEGRWRVRAAVQDHEECYGQARFRVNGVPDTSTTGDSPGGLLAGLAVIIGMVTFAWMLRWRRSLVR